MYPPGSRIDPDVLARLLAGVELVESGGEPSIEIAADIPDLIDAYPTLLLPAVDVELARRQVDAGSEEERRQLAVVRQVLEVCREHGSAAPLRQSVTVPSDDPGGAPDQDPVSEATALSFIMRCLEQQFPEGGVLQAALAVARGVVLRQLMDDPKESRDAIREQALAAFAAGLPVLGSRTPDRDLADLLNATGILWVERPGGDRADNLEEAIACYEAALQVYSRVDTPQQWAVTQNNLGIAYRDRLCGDRADNSERAIACFQASLEVYTKADTRLNWATAQHELGTAYHERPRGDRGDNLERAIACYEAALQVYTQADRPQEWAAIHNNLGIVYRDRLCGDRMDNLERAIACYEAALRVYTQFDLLQEQAGLQCKLGAAYRERLCGDRADNLERAIACFESALLVYTPAGTPEERAEVHEVLGIAYRERLCGDRADNLEVAIACLKAALLVYTQADAPRQWATAQNNLGAIYCERVYTQDDTPQTWAMIQIDRGNTYRERLRGDRADNLEQAISCLEGALPILRLTDPAGALVALIAHGDACQELGRTEQLRAAWEEALTLREELLTAGTSTQTRGQVARRSQDLVARLALLDLSRGEPCAAVATLERGRAAALRAALQLDDIWLADLSDDLRLPIVPARMELENLRAKPPLGAEGIHPGQVWAWEAEIAAAAASLNAALATAHTANGFTSPSPLNATAVVALAPTGGALVQLVAGPEGGAAIVLPSGCTTPASEHVVMLPAATITALRKILIGWLKAYDAFRERNFPESKQLLELNTVLEKMLDRLWETVMSPVLARAAQLGIPRDGELVLFPQGDLALLPLHAAGRKGEDRYVLDDYVIRYAPSGYALRTAHERIKRHQQTGVVDAAGRGRDLFGVFNPMADLASSEKIEMPALADLFAELGQSTAVYLGAEATAARVLADADRAAYLHFSCHGGFNPVEPEASGLRLAGNVPLTVPAIVGELQLVHCRLVVLSACESGMVDVNHSPDEFVGLPAAFLQSGAPGVLATFWSVLDGPTAVLMPYFYSCHLKHREAMSPAAALRKAVLWLRAESGMQTDERLRPRDFEFGDALEEHSRPLQSDMASQVSPLASLPIVWGAYAYHGA